MHLFGQPPGINSALNADRDNATTSKSENISVQFLLDTNALFPIFKSLIWAFFIKIRRNLNENARLRQISYLKVVVISCFL